MNAINIIKENLIAALVHIVGFLPLTIFMDYALSIIMFEAYGLLKTTGFVFCIIFYAEIYRRTFRSWGK